MAKGKGKVTGSKGSFGVKAGGKKMFGQQTVKPSKPGKISQSSPGKGGGFGVKGGSGKMFGYTGSKSAPAR